jgi:type IV secretory pathway VirB2 component (pilin)/type IV secretory pathway TrbD component
MEVHMPRWFQVHLIRRIETILRSKSARLTAALLTLLLVMPVAALAQGSPFDTGFNAIQSLFTGTIAKVASLVAIVIGWCCRWNGHCGTCGECPELALGCIASFPATLNPRLDEGVMPDKPEQKHRTNRVFKSLHKPLTYLGVERTLFYFVCVGAVGAFNLFNSILAGIAVFIGGFAFGHWVTNSDPAFLRILAKSERYKLRYDAAKHQVPRVEVV